MNEQVVEEPVLESVNKDLEDALYESNDDKPKETVDESSEEKTTEETVEEKTQEEVTETEGESKEIEYKLELGKESLLDNSHVESITAFAKENNLSNDQAQKLLGQREETISNYVNAVDEAHEAELAGWRDSVVNDVDMGGDNLKETVASAKKVVEKFGGEDFTNILRDTGYGDNPHVVRFLSNIGKLMSDDSLILPKAAGVTKTNEEVFYGS